jgi:hypothetical protein
MNALDAKNDGRGLETLAADLNAAAYEIGLRHEAEVRCPEWDLDLWNVADADNSVPDAFETAVQPNLTSDPS